MKTTKHDFQIFKDECKLWLDFFGMTVWDVKYYHRRFDTGSEAECMSDIFNANCDLSLDTEIDNTRYCETYIRECAFHEVYELILSKMRAIAQWRNFSECDLNSAVHEVINLHMNTLFKQFRKHVIANAKKEKGHRVKG